VRTYRWATAGDVNAFFGLILDNLANLFLTVSMLAAAYNFPAIFALSGVFKLICALGAGWIRRVVPRAGLLGSLAAVALVLISFLPLVEMLQHPVVGFVSLRIILTTLVARVDLPGRLPAGR